MESATKAVGSQQLADDVDSTGSPTNQKKKKREICKNQKNDLCMCSDILWNILFEHQLIPFP
jgi:hypothetical protein